MMDGAPKVQAEWIDLLDEDYLFDMSIVELRGHLAMLAAPESDMDVAWAVISCGSTVNALFGRSNPKASHRAAAAKQYLQNLDEKYQKSVVNYYRSVIVEMMNYLEAEANVNCCSRLCGAVRELRKTSQYSLWQIRVDLERTLRGDSSL